MARLSQNRNRTVADQTHPFPTNTYLFFSGVLVGLPLFPGQKSALATAFPSLATADMNFNRIASFATPSNAATGEDSGRHDARLDRQPARSARPDRHRRPGPAEIAGQVDMGGEPTSVAVNTSDSYVAPSGVLRSIDIDGKSELAACVLGGQPDSIALSEDGAFAVMRLKTNGTRTSTTAPWFLTAAPALNMNWSGSAAIPTSAPTKAIGTPAKTAASMDSGSTPGVGVPCAIKRPRPKPVGSACRKSAPMAIMSV